MDVRAYARLGAALALAVTLAACSKHAAAPANGAPAASPQPAAASAPAAAVKAAATDPAPDRSHDAAGCADPAWAPKRIAGFTLASCEDKAWTSHDLSLASGAKTVAGHRSSVSYSLQDQGKDPGGAPAKMAIVQQALAAGARLVSDPNLATRAVLQRQTPQGTVWYEYALGAGNDQSTSAYTLTTLQEAPLQQVVQARPMTAALNPKDHACTDPPWLVKQFSYFKVESCEKKSWDVVPVTLATGAQTLKGARVTVVYRLTDDKQSPVAIAVAQNYRTALQAAGAKLLTDPNDGYHAILTARSPSGDLWFIYEHGDGNEESTGSYRLTTVQTGPFPQEVTAKPMAGALAPASKTCAYPPWLVKQFSYFKVDSCSYRDFDQVTVALPSGPKVLAGHILTTNFTLTDPVQDPAAMTVKTNYVNALAAIGATQASDPANGDLAVMTQKTASEGELWYVETHTSGNGESTGSYQLTTVQIGGPAPKTCTIEVYGVNFDFDKSVLRPDSEPVLQQLLALFKANPAYAAEVGGHTDNVGQSAYNLKLSDARAGAVRDWLVSQGVAAGHLTARGYGDTRPLVPNTSDDNRAKNRRVELKRSNCK